MRKWRKKDYCRLLTTTDETLTESHNYFIFIGFSVLNTPTATASPQATTIYSEDFEDCEVGDTEDGWSIDISAVSIVPPNDWFEVREISGNKLMEARDVDGEVVWISEVIDIAGYANVTISVKISERGTMEPQDYTKGSYVDNVTFYFEVESLGFSLYAVVGEKAAVPIIWVLVGAVVIVTMLAVFYLWTRRRKRAELGLEPEPAAPPSLLNDF